MTDPLDHCTRLIEVSLSLGFMRGQNSRGVQSVRSIVPPKALQAEQSQMNVPFPFERYQEKQYNWPCRH